MESTNSTFEYSCSDNSHIIGVPIIFEEELTATILIKDKKDLRRHIDDFLDTKIIADSHYMEEEYYRKWYAKG